MGIKGFTKALVVVGFSAFSSIASADFIQTFSGNDCSGVFGQGFANCKIPANIDPNESPIIIKFEFNTDGLLWTTKSIPRCSRRSTAASSFRLQRHGATGTWTYTPGTGDPGINFFVAKGGPNFNLFSNLDDPLSDDWFTPTNPGNNQPFGLSHLSFYDTGTAMPEPTTLLLLGAGLFAAGFARRRFKRD